MFCDSLSDEFLFAFLLLLGIVFSHFYRKIRNIELKLWAGTIFGILTLVSYSRWGSLYIFVSFAINSVIFKVSKT
jgi:asparagine N-glycosylation enzyme membrane subunit Stt3